MSAIRIATRASPLALAQSGRVAARLEALLGATTELVRVRTSGDRLLSGPLKPLGGKGLFVKEIEEALLQERADVAVHSAKDLPAALAPGLVIVAVAERADPRDALVVRGTARSLTELPLRARVGTGSVRRSAQLRALRPDLEVVPLRGNVDTRLRKLEAEGLDALVLACAGLDRLGLVEHITERLDPGLLLPAPAQGALAVQVRKGDSLARELAPLEDATAAAGVAAERAFLTHLGGDCDIPLAALAETHGKGRLRLRGLVATLDGSRLERVEAEGSDSNAAALGVEAANRLLQAGGREILDLLRQEAQR